MKPWMKDEIAKLTAEHGTVPPPWVIFLRHPCDICWRMGGGEGHLMVWWEWWPRQDFTEEERIAYFRRWPPPYCWLPFLIEAVWSVDVLDYENEDAAPDGYFERTEALGFGSQEDYDRDSRDEKWRR